MTELVKIKLFLLAIISVFVFYSNSDSMPPHPDMMNGLSRSGGEIIQYFKAFPDFEERGINNVSPKINYTGYSRGYTSSGKFLTILVEFADVPSSVDESFFDSLIYNDNYGTVRDYYDEVSYGKLNITTADYPSDIGWITLPESCGYYANGKHGFGGYPNNAQKMVIDAINQADSMIDFSKYDNDNDGEVDGIIVVHSGPGAEFTGENYHIWSHKWQIPPTFKDGVYIEDYTTMPEYWESPGDMTIGVYCHEIGHILGLPDLYDLDGSSAGIGVWSLMSHGAWNGDKGSSPAHPDAWSRIKLGFCRALNIDEEIKNCGITAVESEPEIYRLWKNGKFENSYFLVENRQRIGYDSALPGEGLLIWHIDESQSNCKREWFPESDSWGHYKVALEQADGNWDLEKNNNRGDSGDPFPGSNMNSDFNRKTSPSSDDYEGSLSGVCVENIVSYGEEIYADLWVSTYKELEDLNTAYEMEDSFIAQNYPNPFNGETAITFTIPEPDRVTIRIFNLNGQEIRKLADGYYSAGIHQIKWDATNYTGKSVASGYYFYHFETSERTLTRKMALIK
ncbi:MAG: M6 family metalloprotease domain-containing protein [candidate division Zixibacteria bacterium]|nr:M6 family metalloprotease domain-containing protein [candidate division Zixibacteria bacterium]